MGPGACKRSDCWTALLMMACDNGADGVGGLNMEVGWLVKFSTTVGTSLIVLISFFSIFFFFLVGLNEAGFWEGFRLNGRGTVLFSVNGFVGKDFG